MSRQNALIKLGRLVTADVLDDVKSGRVPADRVYQRGALRLLRREGVPLVVDHDMNRLAHARDEGFGGSFPIHWSSRGWVHEDFVKEVSVLSSAHKPVEPLARVALLERASSAAARTDRRTADSYPDDLEARIIEARRRPLDRLYDEAMAAKAGAGEIIHHPRGVLVRRYYDTPITVRWWPPTGKACRPPQPSARRLRYTSACMGVSTYTRRFLVQLGD